MLSLVSLLSAKNPFILPLEKKGGCVYALGWLGRLRDGLSEHHTQTTKNLHHP